MIINPKADSDIPRELPDDSLHGARVYGIVDLGTQAYEFQGKPKESRKVKISLELDQYMSDGRPFAVHMELAVPTRTYGIEKNGLYKFLKAARGEEPVFPVDLKTLLGMECGIMIEHKISKSSGKPYPNVAAVLNAKKSGKKGPTQNVNKTIWFSLDEPFNQAAYDALPIFIREDIAKSPEYADRGKIKADPTDDLPF